MKFRKIIFSAVVFFIAFFAVSNVKAYNKKVLNTEIIDLCKKYDVGFYYKNPNNMEILSYNSSKKYDPASTNKTYLALCVFKMIKDGKIDINETLEYKKHHKYGGTGQIQYGNVGDKYNIEQLLKLLITQSDNVASRMLRERVGENTLKNFLAQIGTPVKTEKCINQCFSAKDLIKHTEYLFKFIKEKSNLSKKAETYFSTGVYNDKIPAGVPSLHVLHKPGWIPRKLICNDMAIIYDETNNPYFLVIMSQGIPMEEQPIFFQTLTSKIHKYHCYCRDSK